MAGGENTSIPGVSLEVNEYPVIMASAENTTILGVSLDVNESPVMATLEYTAINLLVSSIVPLPLAGTMVAIGALM